MIKFPMTAKQALEKTKKNSQSDFYVSELKAIGDQIEQAALNGLTTTTWFVDNSHDDIIDEILLDLQVYGYEVKKVNTNSDRYMIIISWGL